MEKEIRSYGAEIRIMADGEAPKITGVASCFNVRSGVMRTKSGQEFEEIIAPGAFRNVLQDRGAVALINHDPNMILGRNPKTMTLRETDHGLEFEVIPPDTTYARNLKVSMEREDIDQCSFGFRVADKGDTWARDSGTGTPIRTIRTIEKLFDVSVVTYPQYDMTHCGLREIGHIENIEIPFDDTEIRKLRLEIEAAAL